MSCQIERLENGAYLVCKDMPDRRSLYLGAFVPGGVVYETQEYNGISHLLEHLHLSGTKSSPTREACSKAINSCPGDFEAYTALDHVNFHFQTSPDYFERAGKLLIEIIESREFAQGAIEEEKHLILSEIAGRYGIVMDQVVQAIFRNGGAPLHSAGSPRSLKRIGPKQLADFDAFMFNPERMVVVFAGPVESCNIDLLRNELSGLSARTSADKTNSSERAPRPFVHTMTPRHDGGDLTLGAYISEPLTPEERVSVRLIEHGIFAPSSRLFQSLRYGDINAYYADADCEQAGDSTIFYVSARTAKRQVRSLLAHIFDEWLRLAEGNIPDEWFESSVAHHRFWLEQSGDYPSWVGHQIGMEFIHRKERAPMNLDDVLSILGTLTPRHIAGAARRAFRRENMFVLTGKPAGWRLKRAIWQNLNRFDQGAQGVKPLSKSHQQK